MSDQTDAETEPTGVLDAGRRKFLESSIIVMTTGALAGCSEQSEDSDSNEPGTTTDQQTTDGQTQDGQSQVVELDLVTINRSRDPERWAEMQQVQKQWSRLGIQINLRALGFQEWISAMFGEKHQFKIGHMNWGGDANRIDPLRYMSTFKSGSGYNSSFYSNEEFDAAYNTLRTSYDAEERKQAAFRCQELLCRDLPGVMLQFQKLKGGRNTELFSNWTPMPGNAPYRNVWNMTSLTPNTDNTTVFQPTTSGPNFLQPMALRGNNDNIYSRLVYDRLVRLGPDQARPQPSSAETWEFVDDTTVDVTLKDGLVWSDGESVTPEDVKFTWDFLKEHGQPYLSTHFATYDNSEVLDDRTVRFNLTQPDAGIVSYSFFILPIMPKHVWDGITEEEDLDHPRNWSDPDYTTSGPFKVVEADLPNKAILEANEDYHMDFTGGIERFIVQEYGGYEQMLVELQKGNAAFVINILTNQLQRIQSNSDGSWDHVDPFSLKGIFWRAIQFNMKKEPSNNLALRRACAHATNQQAIVDIAYDGIGAVPAVSGNVVAPHNEYWYNPDTRRYTGGVEKGKQVLRDAGYSWDDQGRLLYPEDMLPIEPPGPV